MRRVCPTILLASVLSAALLTGCGARVESIKPISLRVVVHDHDGFAWEGVEVILLEAWNEWHACICEGKEPWNRDFTNAEGEVFFDARELAYSELGFHEDPGGIAVLGSKAHHDQASIKVLVGHDTLGWVEVTVPFTYRDADMEVFVEL